MSFRFSNPYGSLEVSPRTPLMPIKDIRSEIVPEDCWLSVDEAEKIALIISNEGIQMCFKNGLFYLILHTGPSLGAIYQVRNLEFHSDETPQSLLEQARCPDLT